MTSAQVGSQRFELGLHKQMERLQWLAGDFRNRLVHQLGDREAVDPVLVKAADVMGYLRWCRRIRPYVVGRDVLDLGCGRGLHWVGVLLAGARSYTGADPIIRLDDDEVRDTRHRRAARLGVSPRQAMGSQPRLNLVPGTLRDLPPGRHFDTVIMHMTTEHLRPIDEVVTDLATQLRPGGRIVFLHHNFYCWNGHHVAPRTTDDIVEGDPQQAQVIDWSHITFDAPPGHRIHDDLNRIRLDELRALIEAHFVIEQWEEKAAQRKNGGTRLTPAILARHPGFSERELLTQSVFCVGTMR